MPRLATSGSLNDIIHIQGRIGYVPQTPFIMNASLRDNILFGRPFDEARYQVVPRGRRSF